MSANPLAARPAQVSSADATPLDPPAVGKGSKSTRGRKTKLTPELTEKICSLLRTNNYIETAAAVCGISKECLYEWLRRGAKEQHGPHGEFSDAVRRAQAEGEVFAVSRIAAAALAGNWQAAAWLLERRHRERWGLPRIDRAAPGGQRGQPPPEGAVIVIGGDQANYIAKLREARAALAGQAPTSDPDTLP